MTTITNVILIITVISVITATDIRWVSLTGMIMIIIIIIIVIVIIVITGIMIRLVSLTEMQEGKSPYAGITFPILHCNPQYPPGFINFFLKYQKKILHTRVLQHLPSFQLDLFNSKKYIFLHKSAFLFFTIFPRFPQQYISFFAQKLHLDQNSPFQKKNQQIQNISNKISFPQKENINFSLKVPQFHQDSNISTKDPFRIWKKSNSWHFQKLLDHD